MCQKAFALRPVGGAFFGMLGDRIGRKRVLALTVQLMSAATMVIGILPGYATIGIWAAVLLALARSLQGLSAGGEYAGAVTYVIEHAPASQRSRYSSRHCQRGDSSPALGSLPDRGAVHGLRDHPTTSVTRSSAGQHPLLPPT